MRAVCEAIGKLILSKNSLFQTHGRELSTNITNFLHNFPPEGRYDTNCSITIEDADNPETLWSSIGDNIYSARDVPGGFSFTSFLIFFPQLLFFTSNILNAFFFAFLPHFFSSFSSHTY